MAMSWSFSLSTILLLLLPVLSSCLDRIILPPPGTAISHNLPPATTTNHKNLEYHKGPILCGKLDLSILWYGNFPENQKMVLRYFIESLNGKALEDPQVSSWWKMVEQYQAATPGGKVNNISVCIVKEEDDKGYSLGKTVSQKEIESIAQKVTLQKPGSVALIFTDRDVSVEGTCKDKCSLHGFFGQAKTLYMVVSNLQNTCPQKCGWPTNNKHLPIVLPVYPPSGSEDTDAMVILLASALAETVSNPYNTGFFGGSESNPIEVASACPNVYGSDAFPGYIGKVKMVPVQFFSYNACGVKGSKFLLPSLWNPKTRSCWTLL